MRYSSIDGLRGLSVILVILYHYKVKIFEFGYLGVDIFFVISGFLITAKIQENFNKHEKHFLINFYKNRINRLLPSLVAVLFITIPFFFFFDSPKRFETTFQSLISSLIFLSNYFFLHTNTIYGLPNNNTLPFLHTWSLSIEWQFYIIFPIIYLLLEKELKNFKIYFISLIIILSFSLSWYHLIESVNKFFFSSTTRIWEILVGSFLYLNFFFLKKKFLRFEKIFFIFLTFFLVYFFLNFTKTQNIFYNCLAVYLSSVVIIFNDTKTIKILFDNLILNFFGRISYSLYLWHFPIFIFFKYTLVSYYFKTGLIFIISLGISTISFYFIEKRFRKSLKSLWKFSILYIMLIAIVLISNQKLLNLSKIVQSNLNKNINSYVEDNEDCVFQQQNVNLKTEIEKLSSKRIEDCIKEYDKFVLIIGDSHGEDLHNMFFYHSNKKFIVNYNFGTTPQHKLLPEGYRPIIKQESEYYLFLDFIKKYKKNISSILFTHQRNYLKSDGSINFQQIDMTLDFINNLKNIFPNTIFFGPHLSQNIVINSSAKQLGEKQLIKKVNENIKLIDVDKILSEKSKITYISKIKKINYIPKKDFFTKNNYTFSDIDHFSNFGEKYFSERIFKNLNFKF